MKLNIGLILWGLSAVALALPNANLEQQGPKGLEKRMQRSDRVHGNLDNYAETLRERQRKAEEDANKKRKSDNNDSSSNKKSKDSSSSGEEE